MRAYAYAVAGWLVLVGALGIAGLSLYLRAPGPRHLLSRLAPGLALLRRLHSGHIDDYVA